jgi:hypothetical protein
MVPGLCGGICAMADRMVNTGAITMQMEIKMRSGFFIWASNLSMRGMGTCDETSVRGAQIRGYPKYWGGRSLILGGIHIKPRSAKEMAPCRPTTK